MIRILHITDLHLDNFENGTEFLRKGFYDEYIDKLFLSLKNDASITEIDYLIITGDFVNRGKIDNFPQIQTIINYIIEKFKIDKDHVCLSIGNHDYKWNELNEDFSNEKPLKKPFWSFYKQFNNKEISEGDFFSLKELQDKHYFLSLDSTWHSKDGNPGENIPTQDLDRLIGELKKIDDPETILYIGCHFLIASIQNNFLASEEDNWHDKHVWIKGAPLLERIRQRSFKHIFWFHGDVHASNQMTYGENMTLITTSRFGGALTHSEHRRQAVILSIDNNNFQRAICNYEFQTHSQNENIGNWTVTPFDYIRQTNDQIIKVKSKETPTLSNNTTQPIDKRLEERILEYIANNNLYKFGRFQINDDIISLGWIDITTLISNSELLNKIVEECHKLMVMSLNLNFKNAFFLGLDIVGGILSTHLSVMCNAKNELRTVKNKRNYYSDLEKDFSEDPSNLTNYIDIVIFIDIVSSGKTISDEIEQIREIAPSSNIHVISIFSNNFNGRITSIDNAKSYNSFCTSLKIPLVAKDSLPAEVFIKSDINYMK